MTALFRFLGIRGILLIAAVAVVLALLVRVDVLTANRDAAQSSLATATERLTTAQAERDQAVRDRTRSVVVLTRERDRAVAAERKAAGLQAYIAACAGNPDCDGPTAPVLENTVRGLDGLNEGDRT